MLFVWIFYEYNITWKVDFLEMLAAIVKYIVVEDD